MWCYGVGGIRGVGVGVVIRMVILYTYGTVSEKTSYVL